MNAGDIYGFYHERFNCWHAYQILGADERYKKDVVILLLDWAENRLPVPEDFPGLKPFDRNADGLYIDALISRYVVVSVVPVVVSALPDELKPEKFTYCGNHTVILPNWRASGHSGWYTYEELYIEKERLRNLPCKIREAYIESKKLEKLYKEYMRYQELRRKKLSVYTQVEYDKFLKYATHALRENQVSGAGDLYNYPQLWALHWSTFTPELFNFLSTNPYLGVLVLSGQQPSVLDFSKSCLSRLILDINGVKEIYLPESIERLELRGPQDPDLIIHDPHKGRFLKVFLRDSSIIPKGLEHLYELGIGHTPHVDLAQTLKNSINLKVLRLWPCNVSNFSAISALKKLRLLATIEVFGFTGADFPPPEELPSLENVWLDIFPAEVAPVIKKMYKPLVKNGFVLKLTKPRTPEWIAQNLDNPLRNWDGDEGMPKGVAKKAMDIYKKTRKGFVETCQADNENMTKECMALCRNYITAFNKLHQKHEFIDTLYCEQICEALDKILTDIAAPAGLDINMLTEEYDSLRIW